MSQRCSYTILASLHRVSHSICSQVLLAAAGLEHSLVVISANQSSENYFFAFGDNSYGQLGKEVLFLTLCLRETKFCFQSNAPMECAAITLPNKDSAIVHVAAGGNLSACVDSDGSLWYWGCISEYHDFAVRQPSIMQVKFSMRMYVSGCMLMELIFDSFRA